MMLEQDPECQTRDAQIGKLSVKGPLELDLKGFMHVFSAQHSTAYW